MHPTELCCIGTHKTHMRTPQTSTSYLRTPYIELRPSMSGVTALHLTSENLPLHFFTITSGNPPNTRFRSQTSGLFQSKMLCLL